MATATSGTSAQTHRAATSADVTRAVGVYEWTGELQHADAARLVPVSLFIDGHFHDAGTYLSQPVPLALQTGTQYFLQVAGKPDALFNLDFSRHTAGDTDDGFADVGWFGYGTYAPLPVYTAPRLAESQAKLIGGNQTEEPPSIKRPRNLPPEKKTSSTGDTTQPAGTSRTDTSTAPADDPDRPTLRRHGPKPGSDGTPAETGGSGVTPIAGSLNDDPDRPRLERGRPKSASQAAPLLHGIPPGLHQMVAVSDAADHEAHVFARPWDSPTEQAATLAAMQALARPLLGAYIAATLHAAPATTLHPATAARPAASRTAAQRRTAQAHGAAAESSQPDGAAVTTTALPLEQEQLRGYTLSYGGLPVFVYSAVVPAAAAVASGRGTAPRPELYVTLVAEQLPSGSLQLSLKGVTDARHLDQTPWLRFVDAVDTDWEHRASLLFELRGSQSRQFALYRVLSAHATQYFITEPVQ